MDELKVINFSQSALLIEQELVDLKNDTSLSTNDSAILELNVDPQKTTGACLINMCLFILHFYASFKISKLLSDSDCEKLCPVKMTTLNIVKHLCLFSFAPNCLSHFTLL